MAEDIRSLDVVERDEKKERRKEYDKRYSAKNKEVLKIRYKEWLAKNREHKREYAKEYWEKNKDKINACRRLQ